MKYSLSALACAVVAAGILLGISSPASAALTFTPNPGDTAVPDTNNYKAQLAALGLTHFATGTFSTDTFAELNFFIHGAESGHSDTFTANGYGPTTASVTEPFNNFEGHPSSGATPWDGSHAGTFTGFGAPTPPIGPAITGGTYIGKIFVKPGDLLDLVFTSVSGTDAALGAEGFGIFRQGVGGSIIATDGYIYFGFNDDPLNGDDNHDDLIISMSYSDLGRIDPLPEPASLAIWGAFGVAGLIAARRRKQLA